MGCACTKEAAVQDDDIDIRKDRVHGSKRSTSSGRLNRVDSSNAVDGKERDRLKLSGVVKYTSIDDGRDKQWIPVEPNGRLRNLPKHNEGEQVTAGWPAWLSAVAGDAVKGWIPRRADSFEKLDKIGQGTYSNVYKARDLETGKIVALKKVRFDNLEPESVRFMAREIQVLRRLNHPNIVKLEGLVTSRMSCSIYLVFEYMEHDLAGLAASPGTSFTEPQVKCYLQQLLRGLDHCHSHGVLHRDIKGSNLLIDNEGILKIADFGLATFYQSDQKHPLTSRVVTLWYRPPELLLGATEYGVGVDLWSTGCILAELLAGKPIMPGRTEVEQLHKIFKLCGSPSEDYWKKSKLPHATIFKPKQPYRRCISETFKDFPPSALASIETLLAIEPADRGTAALALKSDFFITKPLACDPASLPKYPPSKELDAKLRDEEARRQRAAGGRIHGADAVKRVGQLGKAIPAPDANAELAISIQRRRMMAHAAKSKSEKFNPRQEDSAVGFPFDPPRAVAGVGIYAPPGRSGLSGYLNAPFMGIKKQKEDDPTIDPPRRPSYPSNSLSGSDLKSQSGYTSQTANSSLSTLVAAANRSGVDFSKQMNGSRQREKFGAVQAMKDEKFDVTESAMQLQGRLQLSNMSVLNRVDSSFRKDSVQRDRQALGLAAQAPPRIRFSGPLLHPSSNLEHILGEHERQVQAAVRRSRYDKGKHQHAAMSQKAWISGSNGSSEIPELGKGVGSQTSSSGRWKPVRSQPSGEIVALCEDERGLSSVVENHDREREV